MTYNEADLRTYTKQQLIDLLTTDITGWNKLYEEARLASDYSWRANLYSANLCSANLRSANLRSANLRSADLRSANLYSANLYSANLRSANLYSANLYSANLRSADLRSANLYSANLYSANLRSANLYSANLYSANLRSADLRLVKIGDEEMTAEQWCDLLDLARVGKNLRLAFKRLPADRITGREHSGGKNLIEWKIGRWVECPDWDESESCGGGLHVSPTAGATRDYSSNDLCVPVAFDPDDAVCLGDKLKLRRVKVLG